MKYKIYRKAKDKESYFNSWESEQFKNLTDALKDQIYNKYLIKCAVFNRDSFKCQNSECKYIDSPLTLHHIRAKRNGGPDTARNGVTLCHTCHQGYEKAKRALIFSKDAAYLPAHIRGHTFKLQRPETVNWKKVKVEMKGLRKNLKTECGINLSWEQVRILMRFLELNLSVAR